jgi:hypothetical protein
MPASKVSASRSIPVLRSFSASAFCRSVSSRKRSASIMLFLNTETVSAIWPISSLRPTPGISTVLSPPASARMAVHIATTGREMRVNPIQSASATVITVAAPIEIHIVRIVSLVVRDNSSEAFCVATVISVTVALMLLNSSSTSGLHSALRRCDAPTMSAAAVTDAACWMAGSHAPTALRNCVSAASRRAAKAVCPALTSRACASVHTSPATFAASCAWASRRLFPASVVSALS